VKEAISFPRIGGGVVVGWRCTAVFGDSEIAGAVLLRFIGGSGAWPMDTIPTFIGAWLGRRFFAKKFGLENWRMYTPVLLAGFACGTGSHCHGIDCAGFNRQVP